jgi:hypothetical protein
MLVAGGDRMSLSLTFPEVMGVALKPEIFLQMQVWSETTQEGCVPAAHLMLGHLVGSTRGELIVLLLALQEQVFV